MWTLIASLTLAAPFPAQAGPTAQPAQEQRPTKAFIGSPTEKWRLRKVVIKDLTEVGGRAMGDRYRKGVAWCTSAIREEGGVQAEDGREAGLTSLVALALLGETTTVTGGTHRFPLRWAWTFLRDNQDPETGALADPESPTFAVDQALFVHAVCEIVYSDGKPKQRAAALKAIGALLEARDEEGLWRVGVGDEAVVDPVATALGAYALFAAAEARIEVPPEALEKLFAWSGSAPAGEGDTRTAALLTTRIFAGAASGSSLKGDERRRELVGLLSRAIPDPTEEGAEAPALATDPVAAYLATLALVQADAGAWGRLDGWLLGPLLLEQEYEGADAGRFPEADNGVFPTGRVATSALRMLAIENRRRELPLSIMVQ